MLDALVAFAVGLLAGAAGVYGGARAVMGVDDVTFALVTALLATGAWIVVATVLGGLPFLGPLIGLAAYVALVRREYACGWFDAVGVAMVAWVAALLALLVFSALDVTSFEAAGLGAA